MKIVDVFKNLVAPSANEQMAKLGAHLLADIGVNASSDRSNFNRIEAIALTDVRRLLNSVSV